MNEMKRRTKGYLSKSVALLMAVIMALQPVMPAYAAENEPADVTETVEGPSSEVTEEELVPETSEADGSEETTEETAETSEDEETSYEDMSESSEQGTETVSESAGYEAPEVLGTETETADLTMPVVDDDSLSIDLKEKLLYISFFDGEGVTGGSYGYRYYLADKDGNNVDENGIQTQTPRGTMVDQPGNTLNYIQYFDGSMYGGDPHYVLKLSYADIKGIDPYSPGIIRINIEPYTKDQSGKVVTVGTESLFYEIDTTRIRENDNFNYQYKRPGGVRYTKIQDPETSKIIKKFSFNNMNWCGFYFFRVDGEGNIIDDNWLDSTEPVLRVDRFITSSNESYPYGSISSGKWTWNYTGTGYESGELIYEPDEEMGDESVFIKFVTYDMASYNSASSVSRYSNIYPSITDSLPMSLKYDDLNDSADSPLHDLSDIQGEDGTIKIHKGETIELWPQIIVDDETVIDNSKADTTKKEEADFELNVYYDEDDVLKEKFKDGYYCSTDEELYDLIINNDRINKTQKFNNCFYPHYDYTVIEEDKIGFSKFVKGTRTFEYNEESRGSLYLVAKYYVKDGLEYDNVAYENYYIVRLEIIPAESGKTYKKAENDPGNVVYYDSLDDLAEDMRYFLYNKTPVKNIPKFYIENSALEGGRDDLYDNFLDDYVFDFNRERDGMKWYEGDYLKQSVSDAIEIEIGADNYGRQTYVKFTKAKYNLTAEREKYVKKEIEKLFASGGELNYLTKDGVTREKKVRACMKYINDNIRGQTSYTAIYHTAWAALQSRTNSSYFGTCQAKAQVLYLMLRYLGIPNKILMGMDASAHTYNIVQMDDGYYYYCDATTSSVVLKGSNSFKPALLQGIYTADDMFMANYLDWISAPDYGGSHSDRSKLIEVEQWKDGSKVKTVSDPDYETLVTYANLTQTARAITADYETIEEGDRDGVWYKIRLLGNLKTSTTGLNNLYDSGIMYELDINGKTMNVTGNMYIRGDVTNGTAASKGKIYLSGSKNSLRILPEKQDIKISNVDISLKDDEYFYIGMDSLYGSVSDYDCNGYYEHSVDLSNVKISSPYQIKICGRVHMDPRCSMTVDTDTDTVNKGGMVSYGNTIDIYGDADHTPVLEGSIKGTGRQVEAALGGTVVIGDLSVNGSGHSLTLYDANLYVIGDIRTNKLIFDGNIDSTYWEFDGEITPESDPRSLWKRISVADQIINISRISGSRYGSFKAAGTASVARRTSDVDIDYNGQHTDYMITFAKTDVAYDEATGKITPSYVRFNTNEVLATFTKGVAEDKCAAAESELYKYIKIGKLSSSSRDFCAISTSPISLDKNRMILTSREGISGTLKATVTGDEYKDKAILWTCDPNDPAIATLTSEGNTAVIDPADDLEETKTITVRAGIEGEDFYDECVITIGSVTQVEAPVSTPYVDDYVDDGDNSDVLTVKKGTRVLLATGTPGADIYYRTDGGTLEPEDLTAERLYSDAIVINEDTTVKAIAVKKKDENSTVDNSLRDSKVVTYKFVIDDEWGDIRTALRSMLFADSIANVPEDLWYVIGGRLYDTAGVTDCSVTYTGDKITFNDKIEVYNGTTRLIENRDYTLNYSNNTNAVLQSDNNVAASLTAMIEADPKVKLPTISIKGKGNYTSTAAFTFGIVAADIDKVDITTDIVQTAVSGSKLSAVKPAISYNGRKLKAGKDYRLAFYRDSADLETNRISEADLKNYKTEAGKTYVVKVEDVEGGNFIPHNSGAKEEAVTVTAIDGSDKSIVQVSKLKVGNIKGKPIKLDYHEDVDDTLSKYYNIGGSVNIESVFDNSSEDKEPLAFVYVKKASEPLVYGTDYEIRPVSDTDNKSAGKHGFVIVGLPKTDEQIKAGAIQYVGQKTAGYEIAGTPMKSVKIAGLRTSAEYTGDEITLEDLFVTDKAIKAQNAQAATDEDKWDEVKLYTTTTVRENNKKKTEYHELGEDVDYTVDMDNSGVIGKFNLTFTGMGRYTGTVKKTITVKAYNMKNDINDSVLIEDIPEQTYVKTGVKPSATVKYVTEWNTDSAGNRTDPKEFVLLREGIDYTLSYKNNSKPADKDVKKAPTVIIKGKGNYTGANAKTTFTIKKADVSQVDLVISDVVYNSNGKAGYFYATPKLTDNGKAVTAGKNKDVESISKSDYIYTYAAITRLEDEAGTVRCIGEEVLPTDKVPLGTYINVTVSVTCDYKSPYLSKSRGTELKGSYRLVQKGFDIKSAKVSLDQELVKAGFFNYKDAESIVPLKVGELIVSMTIKEDNKKVTYNLEPAEYEIVSVENNRFLGTAKVTLKGKGRFYGTKTFTFKIGARSFLN